MSLDIIKCQVKNHKDQNVEYLCKDHDTTGCIKCIVEKHRKCEDVCRIDEIVELGEENSSRGSILKIADLTTKATQLVAHEQFLQRKEDAAKRNFDRKLEQLHGELIKAANTFKTKAASQYSAIHQDMKRRRRNQLVAVNEFQTTVAAMKDKLEAARKVDATTFFIQERTLQNELEEKENMLLQLEKSKSNEELCYEFSTTVEQIVELIGNCLSVQSKTMNLTKSKTQMSTRGLSRYTSFRLPEQGGQ